MLRGSVRLNSARVALLLVVSVESTRAIARVRRATPLPGQDWAVDHGLKAQERRGDVAASRRAQTRRRDPQARERGGGSHGK